MHKFIAADMKSTLTILMIFIISFFCSCIDRNHTKNQDNYQKTDSVINCYELKGNFPDMTILNQEYYGKVFIGVTYDTTMNTFERYTIQRSTLWKKSDKSVYSSYDSDTKMAIPDVYVQIISEIKTRVDNSDLKVKRKKNIEKCTDVYWLILPVKVK